MKKLLFLLLITAVSYGQTYQNPTFGTITTKTAPTTTADPYVGSINASGVIGKVAPEDIPVNVIPPTTHYTPTTSTLKGHFQGIDNAIGNIPLTTAGNTTRVWFTGDATTIGAGTFYLTNPSNKGTVANVSQSVTNDDNQKKYFTQDLIGQPFATATLFPPGVYAGNLSASTTPNSAQQRFTVELYKCNNAGTPIASGVTGAPVGDLGVTVILILDSGLLTLADGSVTNVPVSASLASQFSIAVGERIRYHVSAEKVGTASSNITESIWYGNSFNSFLDVPTPITSSGVSNVSTVGGATVTNALDNLNVSKANDAEVVHKTGKETADGEKTFEKVITSKTGIKVDSDLINYSFVSPNIASTLQQGYAFDGTNHYLMGTSGLSKRDTSWNVIVDNLDPLNGISGVNHIGDGVYLGGFIYVPIESYPAVTGMKIAKYDATTLALVTTYDISAQNHECSALTTDGTTLYISSFVDGTKLWKYSLTGTFLGVINISTPFTNGIQGLSYYLGEFWVSEQTRLSKLSLNGATNTFLGNLPGDISGTHRGEGLEVVSGVVRVSIASTTHVNIYYLTSGETTFNIFDVSSSGSVSIFNDLIKESVITDTEYALVPTGGLVMGSRGAGTVPFIGTRTGSATSTGFFQLAIQNADTPRTSESDMLFRTGFENGSGATQTLTSSGDAFRFYNNTVQLMSIGRNGSTTFSGTISATSGSAKGVSLVESLIATANSDVLVANEIAPTFSSGVFTGVDHIGQRIIGSFNQSHALLINNTNSLGQSSLTTRDNTNNRFTDIGVANSGITSGASWGLAGESFFRASGSTTGLHISSSNSTAPIRFSTNNGVEKMRIFSSGGVSIGNTTDLGAGTLNVTGNVSTIAATTANHAVIKSQLDLKADLASPAFTGTPTAPTAAPGTNTNQVATMAALQTATSAIRPYLVYVALISQSGTSAPTATVLENTLGGTVVFSYTSTGVYDATLSGAFPANKTVFFTSTTANTPNMNISVQSNTVNTFVIVSRVGTVLTDSILNGSSIEVRVYP